MDGITEARGIIFIVGNVGPVCDGKMKGLKLLVLNTENFVSTFGFAISLLAGLYFYSISQIVMICLALRQIQWSNIMALSLFIGNLNY